jgi:hypothetical protein
MHSHDRMLAFWNALAAYVLAPLVMLSVVVGWPGLVQLTLALLRGIAAFAPPVVSSRTRRR